MGVFSSDRDGRSAPGALALRRARWPSSLSSVKRRARRPFFMGAAGVSERHRISPFLCHSRYSRITSVSDILPACEVAA